MPYCCNLALDPSGVLGQPDPRAPPDPTGAQAVVGEHGDHGLLEPPHVVNNEHCFGEPDDRVSDELARPMPGDLASAVNVDHRRAIQRPFVRLCSLACGVDAAVLQEQNGVCSRASGDLGVDGPLQIPRRLVVEMFTAQSQVDELQCHGAESNVARLTRYDRRPAAPTAGARG